MIVNPFPQLQVRTTKYCPHEGCAYGLAVEWYSNEGVMEWVTMPHAQMEWLLQQHLEEHLDPSVRHA